MDDNKYLEDVLVFVDRNGHIVDKKSTPNSCSLKMDYKSSNLEITMHAYSHGMGNGSCAAKVTYDNKVVYEAAGSFTSRPYNVKVKTYKPGPWENIIKSGQ